MAISTATKAATDALAVNRAPVSVGAQEVHKWMQSFTWDFDKNRTKYSTKYKMANDTKEQFKLIAKEYARMESVKDERQFGSLQDVLTRVDAANRVHPLVTNYTIPGYATVDLMAAYSLKVGKSKITAQLNINNLLDKYYLTNAYLGGTSAAGYDAGYVSFGAPRTAMGSIKVEF